MARITHVASARKAQGPCRKCGADIKAGEPYKWFANRIGRSSIRKNYCQSCSPRASDMTTSDKLAQLYSAQETLEDAISRCDNLSDISAALNECAGEAREIADAYREAIDNMPENFQNGSQADEMNEKADGIEAWCDELESAASEIEGMDSSDVGEPADDDECARCGKTHKEHAKHPENRAVECEGATCSEFLPEELIQDMRELAENACGELSV